MYSEYVRWAKKKSIEIAAHQIQIFMGLEIRLVFSDRISASISYTHYAMKIIVFKSNIRIMVNYFQYKKITEEKAQFMYSKKCAMATLFFHFHHKRWR